MYDTGISIRESTTTSTCPKCGFQSIPNARFCQHCGNPLPTQTSPGQSYTSTPRPYYAIQSRPGMSGGDKAVIIVVFLVIIYPGTSFQNNTTGYFGNSYREISFVNYLQPNQIFTTTFTLTNRENTSHIVNTISLAYSPGFTLQSTNPHPPQTVQGLASVTFTVTLQAPNSNYSGFVNLDLFTQ